MYDQRDPAWLRTLSKKLNWLAIPNIAVIFLTLQVLGFFFVYSDPVWIERLCLIPQAVLRGEVWRLVTFLALPLSMSPIWMIFSLWFLYYILNSVESEWGAFKTTFYILVSIVLTLIFSFVFGYPVTSISDFVSTLFLATAALFPETEIMLFMVVPVKMKYLGWMTLGFLGLRLLQGTWIDRLYLVTIYSNYLIFFGPALIARAKQWQRRRKYNQNR
jgi:membrane associated rhomboid family serine protease